MDKDKRLSDFPLQDEFAVNLKLNFELPDPITRFKLLFPSKKATDLHQATITNLNAITKQQVYLPAHMNLNLVKINLLATKLTPENDELTHEEEDILEIPRFKKPEHNRHHHPIQSHTLVNPVELTEETSQPQNQNTQKKSFEEFADHLDNLDEFIRDPKDVLQSVEDKLKSLMLSNIANHKSVSQTQIATLLPNAKVIESLPILPPETNPFRNERVIQSIVSLRQSKLAKLNAPAFSMITINSDNNKIMSCYFKSKTSELYKKEREFVIYVPGEYTKRATGSANNLFYKDNRGTISVISIDHSVDIRRENKNFEPGICRIDQDQNVVPIEEHLHKGDGERSGQSEKADQGFEAELDLASKRPVGEEEDGRRLEFNQDDGKMQIESQESDESDDSLHNMIIEK